MVFHLVSRTVRREALFVPEIRSEIARLIPAMVRRTDASLLAYAIMPNHLHIVLRQGRAELRAVMQPLLTRVARRVQRWHGLEGPIVERTYFDQLCETVDHEREVLVYTHLNPWRAGLCADDLAYPWTTHAAYLPGADPSPFGIDRSAQARFLEVFAAAGGRSHDDLRGDYLRWVEWRMAQDRARAEADVESVARSNPAPTTTAPRGATAGPHPAPPLAHRNGRPDRLPDLRDFVAVQTAALEIPCAPGDLRGSWLSRPLSRCRARVIRHAAERGYRTTQIADFFAISPAAVSRSRYGRNGSGPWTPVRLQLPKGKR